MATYPVWRGPAGALESEDRARFDRAIEVAETVEAVVETVTQAKDAAEAASANVQQVMQDAATAIAPVAADAVRLEVAAEADRAQAAAQTAAQDAASAVAPIAADAIRADLTAAVAAEADRAEAARDDASAVAGIREFRDLPALLASATLTYGAGAAQVQAGDVIRTRAEGYAFRVAALGTANYHLATAGGVLLLAQLNEGGWCAPEQFGARGNGTADDSEAFRKLLNAFPELGGFDVRLGPKTYKINNLVFYLTRAIRFIGAGYTWTRLDFSGCSVVANWPYLSHIICVHPNNVTGSSTFANPIALPAGWIGNNGQGADLSGLSVISNPAVENGNGVVVNIKMHSLHEAEVRNANLHCWLFVGRGTTFATKGDTVGPSGFATGGNSNNGEYGAVRARGAVNGDGIHIVGLDANQNQFRHPDVGSCGGWGINDNGFLGNSFLAPHEAYCGYGAYKVKNANSRSAFLFPYIEGGGSGRVEMTARNIVLGGMGQWMDFAEANAIEGNTYGVTTNKDFWSLSGYDYATTGTYTRMQKTGGIRFKTSDGLLQRMERQGSAYTGYYNGNDTFMLLPNVANLGIRPERPYFPNGLALTRNGVLVAAAAVPTSGDYVRGQVIFNDNPAAAGVPGWVCTTGGAAGSTAVFKPMANLGA